MITILVHCPLLQLLCLFILAVLIRQLTMAPGSSPAASGAIVMAGGIVTLDALQQVSLPVGAITRLATLILLVIGAFIAGSYVAVWMRGMFHRYTDVPVDSFAIGTWVAGASVLAQTVLLAFPGWREIALGLGLLASLLWVSYLWVAARALRAILPKPVAHHVTGRILLLTVATQSVAILMVALFPEEIAHGVFAGLIVLGYLFYALGIALVAERYHPRRVWSLADDWDTTNCILHGAMSISGLAGILTGVLSVGWIDATWLWVAGVFLLVEGIELARAQARVVLYGWREGLLTYHVTQWARVFTFGMFYAFTLHLPVAARHALPLIAALRTPIVTYGHFVVLGLFVLEAALFARANMRLGARATDSRPVSVREA